MEKPVISVIMGTYNPKIDILNMAIQSIISQTFTSWEFLIYDDGSASAKYQELEELIKCDPRIRCIRGTQNLGLAHALNECLKEAQGTYIARMDDDDLSYPGRFEEQKKFLDNNTEYAWVGCVANLFDKDGIWGMASRPEIPEKTDFLQSSPFVHPSVMFRRQILVETGGYRVSTLTSRCEDYELFMRLYAVGYKGYNLQNVFFQYRENSRFLHRSLKYCFFEMLIRIQGYWRMKILTIRTVPYIVKPIFVGIASCFPTIAQRIRTNRSEGDHIVQKGQ